MFRRLGLLLAAPLFAFMFGCDSKGTTTSPKGAATVLKPPTVDSGGTSDTAPPVGPGK